LERFDELLDRTARLVEPGADSLVADAAFRDDRDVAATSSSWPSWSMPS
jgi:hypothetical protein